MNLDTESVGLFIAFVVPGFVSISVYRLIMPSREWEWSSGLMQGLFYSSLNFIVLLPLILYVATAATSGTNLARAWLGSIAGLLVLPALWPILLRALFRSEWVARRIQIPYPTPWDYCFDSDRPAFVLVHLKSGRLLGGYWGGRSYAGSSPEKGDIYLEAIYQVDEEGGFGEPIPHSRGVLLTKEEYSYLELYEAPEEE